MVGIESGRLEGFDISPSQLGLGLGRRKPLPIAAHVKRDNIVFLSVEVLHHRTGRHYRNFVLSGTASENHSYIQFLAHVEIISISEELALHTSAAS